MTDQKQIYILYAKIPEHVGEDVYKKCLVFLPDSLRDKHFRFRRWQDRAANLFSKVLLLKALARFGYDHQSLEQLRYNEFGRPHLPGTVDFNISHSGHYIICAAGDKIRVGIDIEEIKEVDFSDFENLMTKEQWLSIRNAPDPFNAFFRYWAIKESIIKADGRGLSVPLNDILISDNQAYYDQNWYLNQLHIDDSYAACLASDSDQASIDLKEIDLNGL